MSDKITDRLSIVITTFSGLIQFVKFGIVGLSNTAISYGIDMLCYYVILAPVAWSSEVKVCKNRGGVEFEKSRSVYCP